MQEINETNLKNKLIEIENRCMLEELDLVMKETRIDDQELAYDLLMKYRNIWEFTSNVATSGDSLIITLPKKAAKERGIKKGTPIFIAIKTLRFFKPKEITKLI